MVALLLGWLVPGAGHLYLGKVATAIVALVLVGGMYLVGLNLTEGRTPELLDPEMRGPVALALSPEAGNLGGLLFQLQRHGDGRGPVRPQPLPEHIHLGSLLTALSGLLNLFLLVHVHTTARLGSRRGVAPPGLLVLAGWLLPGLGHWLQGRRARAAVVFALLVGLLLAGTWLAEASNLSRDRHFYYWVAQLLAGLPAILLEQLSGRPAVTGPLPLADVGLLYAAMAGLLNLVLLIDVYAWQEALLRGADPLERDRAPAAAHAEPVATTAGAIARDAGSSAAGSSAAGSSAAGAPESAGQVRQGGAS
jgi:hypothetical protein